MANNLHDDMWETLLNMIRKESGCNVIPVSDVDWFGVSPNREEVEIDMDKQVDDDGLLPNQPKEADEGWGDLSHPVDNMTDEQIDAEFRYLSGLAQSEYEKKLQEKKEQIDQMINDDCYPAPDQVTYTPPRHKDRIAKNTTPPDKVHYHPQMNFKKYEEVEKSLAKWRENEKVAKRDNKGKPELS